MVYIDTDGYWKLEDLAMFVEPVEISDANGKLLGLFVPANMERGKELYAKLDAKTDWAELERRAQSKEKGFTTEEVLAHLESLSMPASAGAGFSSISSLPLERGECGTP